MTQKLYLPQDIEALAVKAEKKKRIRLCVCTVMFILAALFVILLRDRLFRSENIGFGIFLTLIVLVLPFIITDIPSRLKDITYCGTIEGVDVKTTVSSGKEINSRRLTSTNHVYLYIKTPDGMKLKHKAFSVGAGSVVFAHIQRTYKQGKQVFHICGSELVTILPTKDDATLACSVCADMNDISSTVCRSCGHTLIKELPIKPVSPYSHINPRY
ncbi:MAG: hypothetical protein IJ391_00550 [Clostridia bacterium]|nr:hypothetical protein [Clostridia bacterium]